MTTVARRFAAVPARRASETWKEIIALVAPDPESRARTELISIINPVSAMIASEMGAAIVFRGSGPMLRVYCLYGEDAVGSELINERPLGFVPTDGEWAMSLPCPTEDVEWVQRRLADAPHVSARDESAPAFAPDEQDKETRQDALTVDRASFLRS